MTRDMTQKQFETALKKNGISPRGFLGYHTVCKGVSVCALNAGSRRRDQLAYLLREQQRIEDKYHA